MRLAHFRVRQSPNLQWIFPTERPSLSLFQILPHVSEILVGFHFQLERLFQDCLRMLQDSLDVGGSFWRIFSERSRVQDFTGFPLDSQESLPGLRLGFLECLIWVGLGDPSQDAGQFLRSSLTILIRCKSHSGALKFKWSLFFQDSFRTFFCCCFVLFCFFLGFFWYCSSLLRFWRGPHANAHANAYANAHVNVHASEFGILCDNCDGGRKRRGTRREEREREGEKGGKGRREEVWNRKLRFILNSWRDRMQMKWGFPSRDRDSLWDSWEISMRSIPPEEEEKCSGWRSIPSFVSDHSPFIRPLGGCRVDVEWASGGHRVGVGSSGGSGRSSGSANCLLAVAFSKSSTDFSGGTYQKMWRHPPVCVCLSLSLSLSSRAINSPR